MPEGGETVITTDEAFDLLVESSPSYFATRHLDEYLAAFEEEGQPDLFVRTSAFAHHVVELLAAGRDDEARAVFVTIEHLLEDGDEDTVELVELGLIEAVQNIVSHEDVLVGPDRVVPLLGPRAAGLWETHAELWRDAGRWRHDGPRVEQADYDRIVDPNLKRYFQAHKRRLDDGALISASDIVHYQSELANLSPITPAGRPRIPWTAVAIGLVLAVCLAIALNR
jgi:hypothetical protein